ncbi:disintegrin and metalloproteinase domain-containing protein 8-like [Dysidea avara]|uniref:disintegrin and metalloproteinase domain-containing protein 8-like n=1 Tax=Dysidea avara TaxID=196820 RepID=UPI00331ABEDF
MFGLLLIALLAISGSSALAVNPDVMILRDLEGSKVYDYEKVQPTVILQSEETTDANPHELWIRINTSLLTFELHLMMNRDLLSPDYTQTYIENGKIVYRKENYENCYYQGSVVGFPHWSAALSTCDGLRGAFGDFSNIRCLYHIDPIESISDEIQQAHIVYRNGSCGHEHVHKDIPHNFTTKLNVPSDTRIVDLVMISDYYQYIALGRSLTNDKIYTTGIVNIVNMIYAKVNIRITITGSNSLTDRDDISIGSTILTYLYHLASYDKQHLIPLYPHRDATMMLSAVDFGGSLGIAFRGSACSNNQAPVGLTGTKSWTKSHTKADVASTVAHELGHILGLRHTDGRSNCKCSSPNGKCLMDATDLSPLSSAWSSCSISDLKMAYNDRLDKCLAKVSSTVETTHLISDERMEK